MKKILLIIFIILLPGRFYAQLMTPTITSAPACLAGPGTSGTITCTPIPGATGYEWISTIGPVHSIWFPNAPGPFISSVPSANVLCNLGQVNFEICVRAFNAFDTSAWACVQIPGVPATPVFLPTNDPFGIPGDSGYYAINSGPCTSYYIWTITGDATFNNNSQSITSPFSWTSVGVNVNFGPNFTSGILCVVGIAQTGLSSDTVCMVIIAPVGINEPMMNFGFISEQDKIIVEFSSTISEKVSVIMFDVSGKSLSDESVTININQNQLEFSTANLNPGIYFLELTGKNIHKQFKFVRTE